MSSIHPDAHQIHERFLELSPWTRFDEWTGIFIEVDHATTSATSSGFHFTAQENKQLVCAFFGQGRNSDYQLMILRGHDPCRRYLQYRSGEWIPEFGLDFATSDAIQVGIIDDNIETDESCKPGQPPEPLRMDEKRVLYEVLDAINTVVSLVDQEKLPMLGETEDFCYHLWKVGKGWRAEVTEFPEEQFLKYDPIEIQDARLKRIKAAGLLTDGVWEASSFFLPATRFQGDQEVFVQCAGIAESATGLLGLVTLEAHADPEHELAEALIGSIEKQKRIPLFFIVKEEKAAERLLPILSYLGIHVRLRKRLRELEHIRDQMIESFPEDEEEDEDSSRE
jgi:hypothetical protein